MSARWTLGRKILLMGTCLGILTVLQGYFSLTTIYGTRTAVQKLDQDTYSAIALCGQIKALDRDQRLAMEHHLGASDAAEFKQDEAAVAKAESDLRALLDSYPVSDAATRDALAGLSAAEESSQSAWNEMRPLSRNGDKPRAWVLYNTRLHEASLALQKAEDALTDAGVAHAELLVQNASSRAGHGIPIIWGLLLFTVVVGTAGAFSFSQLVTRSIKPLEQAILLLGDGILKGKVDIHTADDIGYMASYMNGALDQMTCTVSGIDYCSHKIADATGDLLARASSAAEASLAQRDRAQQIGDSMREMVESFQLVSKDSKQASDSAHNAVEIARQGGVIVNESLQNMKRIAESVRSTAQNITELGKSSDAIGKIVAVITEIAEQTNLLALNAAIEAARAGEQGRGFAVVAGEVRRLAERTTSATKEIAHMIETVQAGTHSAVVCMQEGQQQVEEGVTTTTRAGESLGDIISAAQSVGDMILRISSAANQQGATARAINLNVEEIERLTAESAEDARQSTNSCQNLSELTHSLEEIISQFQFRQIISNNSQEESQYRAGRA